MASTAFIRSLSKRAIGQTFQLKSTNQIRQLGSVRFSSYFTESHEYVKVDGKIATCGITDYAQDLLGDIVFVDLPDVDDEFEKSESFGSVESVKAASDVYAPVTGTVLEVNDAITDAPDMVNQSPEDKGWFMKMEMSDESELDDLMTPEAYKEHCESL